MSRYRVSERVTCQKIVFYFINDSPLYPREKCTRHSFFISSFYFLGIKIYYQRYFSSRGHLHSDKLQFNRLRSKKERDGRTHAIGLIEIPISMRTLNVASLRSRGEGMESTDLPLPLCPTPPSLSQSRTLSAVKCVCPKDNASRHTHSHTYDGTEGGAEG